LQEVVIS